MNQHLLVSSEFRKTIELEFGEPGKIWLEQLPQQIERLKNQWDLSSLQVHEELSFNYIAFGKQNNTSNVVLKLGFPHRELLSEIEVLRMNRENDAYVDFLLDDAANGALLLERILPGFTLLNETDLNRRLGITAELIKKTTHSSKQSDFSTMLDWCKAIRTPHKNSQILQLQLFALRHILPKYKPSDMTHLMHGDLHHENIIYDQNSANWRVIDPKGVLAPRGFACARYLHNHLPHSLNEIQTEICHRAEYFANALAVPKQDIIEVGLLDALNCAIWGHDDGEFQKQHLVAAMAMHVILTAA
jgi:streptomycin 6-kinase